MKPLHLMGLLVLCLLFTFSCTNSEENLVEQDTLQSRFSQDSRGDICEDSKTSNYTNGPQSRSFVQIFWDFQLDSQNLPGLVNFHVQFQAGFSINGDPQYGTVYDFTHTYLSTETSMSETYSALDDLEGNVQGRWRVRVEDCDWSPWIDYYFP